MINEGDKWRRSEFLDTACGGVTQHTVENVSDQINNDEKNNNRFIWLFTLVYYSKLSRLEKYFFLQRTPIFVTTSEFESD